jgi:glycerophosphoryl diester phosphodiesterase
MSRDGVLVARHDCELSRSTDVASRAEFAGRRTRKSIDGELVEGWFCEDFSFDELRRLRAREPLPELRGRAHDGLHAIPAFDEIVAMLERESQQHQRTIGIIPELKNSTYHRSVGLDLERALEAATQRHAVLGRVPFGIQSFEVANLEALHDTLCASHRNIFLVQLIGDAKARPFDRHVAGDTHHDYARMLAPRGLAAIARYAHAVAVQRRRIVPLDEVSGSLAAATPLVAEAHAAGLAVQAWTVRPENHFLAPALRCGTQPATRCQVGMMKEIHALIGAGVDGIFVDDPALGRQAVDWTTH